MKSKQLLSLLLVLVLLLGASAWPAAAASQHNYSKTSNSGIRDEVCTSLSGTSASSYYTQSFTYEALSGKSSSALLQSLRTLMKSTHDHNSSYSDCKTQSVKTDCQNNDGKVTLIYISKEVALSDFKGGGTGWDREHVWPKSLGGFENSGAGADLHHVRPSDSRVNNTRGNLKYGNVSSGKSVTGYYSIVGGDSGGGYFEPLDNVKGDVARICLYVYVRYGGDLSKCSSITNVFQSVDVLLEWMELDPVDTWEMGRNEVVQEIQGNRNVFIDYPEYAWLLFGREVPEDLVTPSGNAANTSTQPTQPTQPPVTQPTQPPVTQPATQPPVTQPVQQPTTQPPVTQPAQPPATKPTQPPATQPAQPPATQPVNPPATKPTQPSATQPSTPSASVPIVPTGSVPDTTPSSVPIQPSGSDPSVPSESVPAPTQPADQQQNSVFPYIWATVIVVVVLCANGVCTYIIIKKKK